MFRRSCQIKYPSSLNTSIGGTLSEWQPRPIFGLFIMQSVASVHNSYHFLQVEDDSAYSCLNFTNNSKLSKGDT